MKLHYNGNRWEFIDMVCALPGDVSHRIPYSTKYTRPGDGALFSRRVFLAQWVSLTLLSAVQLKFLRYEKRGHTPGRNRQMKSFVSKCLRYRSALLRVTDRSHNLVVERV